MSCTITPDVMDNYNDEIPEEAAEDEEAWELADDVLGMFGEYDQERLEEARQKYEEGNEDEALEILGLSEEEVENTIEEYRTRAMDIVSRYR